MEGQEFLRTDEGDSGASAAEDGVGLAKKQIREFDEIIERMGIMLGNDRGHGQAGAGVDIASPPAPEINVTAPNSDVVTVVDEICSYPSFLAACDQYSIAQFGSRSAPPCLGQDSPGFPTFVEPNRGQHQCDQSELERQQAMKRHQKYYRATGVKVDPNYLSVQQSAAASSKSESNILDVYYPCNDGPLLAKAPKLALFIRKHEARAEAAGSAVACRKTSVSSSSSSAADKAVKENEFVFSAWS